MDAAPEQVVVVAQREPVVGVEDLSVWKEIDTDHRAQISWSPGFDALALYKEVLRELRGCAV